MLFRTAKICFLGINQNKNNYFYNYLLSIEYFPGPIRAIATKPVRYNNGNSCLLNGSLACTIRTATVIVAIGNNEIHLVLNPTIISIGAINSAKTAKISVGTEPIPSGSPNSTSSANNLFSFPHP